VGADLGRRAEQRAQAGRVAEVDVGEIDEQPRPAGRPAVVQVRAQLRRRGDVELAGHGDDAHARLVALDDREWVGGHSLTF
jgi:hypothetical protein